MAAPEPPPTARGQGLALLEAVFGRRQRLDDALAELPADDLLARRDRAMARKLAATVLRRCGELDALIDARLQTAMPRRRHVRNILRQGVAELLFVGTPSYAAVDGAVELAKTVGAGHYAGLINGMLRSIDRAAPALLDEPRAARRNTPDWLWRSWSDAYGPERASAIAVAHMREPRLDLTVKTDAPEWANRLGATVLPTGSLRLAHRGPIAELDGFADGAWWVQDAAAALPVGLLGEVDGKSVLDMCAAPGGKAAQLASRGADVTAIDRSPKRLDIVRQNFARLGLSVGLEQADARSYAPGRKFDAILLDAPCSATGTIRRHPDIARLKTPQDVARAVDIQRAMLVNAVALLVPGGTLVYAVCSLEPAEGPEQVRALLAGGAPVALEPVVPEMIGGLETCIAEDGTLRTLPSHLAAEGGMDGFYAARLRRV